MKRTGEILEPSKRSGTAFIRDKRGAIWAAVLTVICLLLVIDYPGPRNWLEEIFVWAGLPLSSRKDGYGLDFTGLVFLGLFLIILFLISNSFGYHRLLLGILLILSIQYVPSFLTNTYQTLFTSGVYALKIEQNSASCSYRGNDSNATCQLTVKNLSPKPVSVTGFIGPHHAIPDINLHIPFIEVPRTFIPARSTQVLEVKVKKEKESVGRNYVSWNTSGVIITLSDGKHERTWHD